MQRSPCVSRFAGRICDPWGSCWSSLLLKQCAPWRGPTLEQFVKDCIPWEGSQAAAEEEGEKEGVAGRRCYEPAVTFSPYPLHPFKGGCRGFGSEEEKEPEQDAEKWWRESSFSLVLFLSTLICFNC